MSSMTLSFACPETMFKITEITNICLETSIRYLLFYITLFLICPIAMAKENHAFSLETGLYYSEGDYHRNRSTTIQYLPLTAKYQTKNFQFKLSGGWLSLKGPGNIETGTQTASEFDEYGLADTHFSSAYYWRTSQLKLIDWLVPEFKIKIPTADKNKALGTGTLDGQIILSFYRIRAPLTLHSSLSHRWRSNKNELNLRNSWGFNFGTVWQWTKYLSTGIVFDTEEAASTISSAKRELLFHVSVKITRKIKTTLYSQYGLSNGSPEVSFGTQVAYKF